MGPARQRVKTDARAPTLEDAKAAVCGGMGGVQDGRSGLGFRAGLTYILHAPASMLTRCNADCRTLHVSKSLRLQS
jgi:hypothetical protein